MDQQEYVSPYHPVNVLNLFLFPKKFFTENTISSGRINAALAIILYSAARMIGEIEEELFKYDWGAARSSDNVLISLFSGSWLAFWIIVLSATLINSFLLWWIGGWWFRVRVGWSGDPDPDPVRARAVYAYASLTFALPLIGYKLLETLAYRDPLQAFYAEDWLTWLSAALLIFPFWSLFTAFSGVRSQFEVSTWKALFWFVGLQGGIYVAGYLLVFISALFF